VIPHSALALAGASGLEGSSKAPPQTHKEHGLKPGLRGGSGEPSTTRGQEVTSLTVSDAEIPGSGYALIRREAPQSLQAGTES
jgi:hypothetical protein